MKLSGLELKVHEIDPDDVLVPVKRQRKENDPKKLKTLMDSISQIGQIQPGVCRLQNDKVILIAGWRRWTACKELQRPYKYILQDETDEWTLHAIELAENLERENLSWVDEVKAKEELHTLYETRYGKNKPGTSEGHSIQDTADMLGESRGLVSQDIALALLAKELPEVAKARNKTEAKKIVKRLRKEVERRKKIKETTESAIPIVIEGIETMTQEEAEKAKAKELERQRILLYDRQVIHGDILEIDLPPRSFDIILFDPPWGVEYDKNKLEQGAQRNYTDDRKEFKRLLPQWLDKLESLMKEDSFLYMFYAMPMYHFVYTHLKRREMAVDPIPIIWHKKGMHRTRSPEISHGRAYEPIFHARKGTKKLIYGGRSNIIQTPPPGYNLKDSHPSAKHPEIYRELLERSATPGDSILDPMAGSGMAGVAAEDLQANISFTLVEKEQSFRDLAIFNLVQGFSAIAHAGSKPTLPNPHGFPDPRKENIWIGFWKAFPELQDEMLSFRGEFDSHLSRYGEDGFIIGQKTVKK
jgi:ParB/RepB/Spo0J family partition protein